jgi:MFS superfamily sulfate permease-like transporter
MHVPINIPSLSMSTHHDVDMNKELIAHGYANLLGPCAVFLSSCCVGIGVPRTAVGQFLLCVSRSKCCLVAQRRADC